MTHLSSCLVNNAVVIDDTRTLLIAAIISWLVVKAP